MHITLETDYAIRIVDFMAKNSGRLDAKTISEKTSVPQTFAMKILRNVPDISINTFTEKDVVRHKLVQDIIKAYEKNEEKRK